jgi:hypothetical protein
MNLNKLKVVLLCCFFTCLIQCSDMKSLPSEIAGKWTTTDTSYQGEYIEISTNALTYGSESKGSFDYTIIKVQQEKATIYNHTLYHVYCNDQEGVENLFSFLYSPEDGGMLRQKATQDIVWKKTGQ